MSEQDPSPQLADLEAISNANNVTYNPQLLAEPQQSDKQKADQSTYIKSPASKGIRTPNSPKVKAVHNKQKPGARTHTTLAQRNASRRNMKKTLVYKAARLVK